MSKKKGETFKPNSDPFCLLRDISCLHRALRPNMPPGLFFSSQFTQIFPFQTLENWKTLENSKHWPLLQTKPE